MDGLVATIAGSQGGVLSARQLRWAGLSSSTIRRREATGRLYRQAQGVYSLTPILGENGRRWAALLAAGADRPAAESATRQQVVGSRANDRTLVARTWHLDGSVLLSHWSALHLAGIVDRAPARHDVTVVGARRAPRNAAIIGHVAARLEREDRGWCRGMPCVSAARALIEIAPDISEGRLRRLIREAQFRGSLDARRVASLLARLPTHPGVAALRRVDPDLMQNGQTPLEVEIGAFLERETALAPWVAQHWVRTPTAGWCRLDFARPDLLLAVEADGGGAHVTTQGRSSDAERDAEMAAAGWETVRIMRAHVSGPVARRRTADRLHRIAARRGWRAELAA